MYNLTSSANSFAVTSEKLSVTSLIKILNRTGPKTLPCGIPLNRARCRDMIYIPAFNVLCYIHYNAH